jgi:hypothetical protein
MLTKRWQEILAAKALLGLGGQASLQEIKAAYRKLAKECHPDLAGQTAESGSMRELSAAYAVLLAYCSTFRFPLVPSEGSEPMDPEDWWLDRFGEDPLWGRNQK